MEEREQANVVDFAVHHDRCVWTNCEQLGAADVGGVAMMVKIKGLSNKQLLGG